MYEYSDFFLPSSALTQPSLMQTHASSLHAKTTLSECLFFFKVNILQRKGSLGDLCFWKFCINIPNLIFVFFLHPVFFPFISASLSIPRFINGPLSSCLAVCLPLGSPLLCVRRIASKESKDDGEEKNRGRVLVNSSLSQLSVRWHSRCLLHRVLTAGAS